MFGKRPGSSDADPERAVQIDAIVNDVMRRYEAGLAVDITVLERAHPGLMPELAERLHAVEAIGEARRRILVEPPAPASPGDVWLEQDLEFLRSSLAGYDVLGQIRHGGQGVVYKARQEGTNRIVAIKVLLDGPLATERQRQRFEREIDLISRLRHPNIITLHDAGIVRGRHYFAMEFVEGLPINDYAILHDLTPREIVRLFVKVCRAISYAHQNGVIHRDLSPANILVDEQGEPHVFDFGLAKDVWASGGAQAASLTGQVFGTLQYLSPEQAGGLDGKADVRSDIYTLGVVLYHLLSDEFPYSIEGDPQEVRNAILNIEAEPLKKATARGGRDRIREPDAISRDLEAILAKALAKRKEERYQSAAEFADDLDRYLVGDAVEARRNNRTYLLRKTFRRYRVPVTVAGIVLATLALAAAAVTASWVQARIERDNAREAARVAYDLFDTAVTDMDTSVRPLAGGVAVRDRMIACLADQLPRLAALIESDEALDAISTRLAEKRGDLAFEQGQRADAARHYQAFLAGSRRLAELESSNPAYLDSVARAYRKYAGVSDEPAWFYERGIRFAQEVLEHSPHRDEARYGLAKSHAAFGKHLVKSEHYSRALEHFDVAQSLCSSEGAEANERWAQLVAVAKDARGRILLKLGEGTAGLAELAASLRIRERISEVRPADTISRYDLMLSYAYIATAQRDGGHLDEAKELLQKAIKLGELLRTMDPTAAKWGLGLYGAYDKLVRLHLASGDPGEAQALCDVAVTLAEELARTDDQTAQGKSTLGFAHILRGQVFLAREAPEQAYEAFEQAAAIRKSLLATDPENSVLLESLAVAHTWLGKSSRKMNSFRRALQHYQTAYEIRTDLYREQPHLVERALDLIKSQTNLAVVHLDYDTAADDAVAASLLEEGERLLETLQAAGKLLGSERKYETWISAIRGDQAIIQERTDRRNSATNSISDTGDLD